MTAALFETLQLALPLGIIQMVFCYFFISTPSKITGAYWQCFGSVFIDSRSVSRVLMAKI